MRSHPVPVPVYLTVRQVAERLSAGGKFPEWTARDCQKTRRWMKKEGVLIWRGGRQVTTPDRLIESFPEVLDRIMLELRTD